MKAFLKVVLYKPLYNLLILLVWIIPGHSVGWAIILLTILVRLLLTPSSLKAIKIQKKMQDLQPELQKIREQHKNDQQAQTKATLEFYQRNKMNPLGGCLPMLIQLPILLVLYQVFTVGLNNSRFDLLYSFTPHPDLINTVFLGMNLAEPNKWVLPLITGGLQYLQVQMMQWGKKTKKDKTQEPTQQEMINKQMNILLPIMTVWIAMKVPAALALYWLTTTLFAIVQQYLFFKHLRKGEVKVKYVKKE